MNPLIFKPMGVAVDQHEGKVYETSLQRYGSTCHKIQRRDLDGYLIESLVEEKSRLSVLCATTLVANTP